LVPPIKGKWFFPEGIFWAEEPPCFSTTRGTFSKSLSQPKDYMPQPDSEKWYGPSLWSFGSSHPTIWHMAFCDGSVQAIGYEIEDSVHRAQANRLDGEF
ncbi:MAG: hypothetical protein SH868_14260, partial [Bythopirellula sp.]|nr:hypothetical protein [Bythopirellula sp.]